MEINKLPIGTQLIWDAPLPYEGYICPKSLIKGKILYTAIVSERDNNHPRGTRVKTSGSNNWMGNTSGFLRKPTEKELTEYKWPKL